MRSPFIEDLNKRTKQCSRKGRQVWGGNITRRSFFLYQNIIKFSKKKKKMPSCEYYLIVRGYGGVVVEVDFPGL